MSSAEATYIMNSVSKGEMLARKRSNVVADAVEKVACHVAGEVSRYAIQSVVVGVSSSLPKYADMATFRSHIRDH